MLVALLGLTWFSASGSAQICNPSNTSGCPALFPGARSVKTPTAVPGTGYTSNGVTTASIDVMWGLGYNRSVCPYSEGTGGNQSSCDLAVIMPHEAPSNPNNYEIVFCFHGGGGSSGGNELNDCWASSAGPVQQSILYVQKYLGTPNAVGGQGIVVILVNYRLTAGGGLYGTNSFPAQWQDAKCAVWHVLANSSTFPGNKSLIGMYGPSWGGTMVWWAAETPDNAYAPSCDSSAPGTDPQYRIVAAWPALAWLYPLNNASFDNVNLTQAYKNAIIGQMNSNVESTIQANCAAMSPNCDPVENIVSANLAVYQNVQALFQFGSYGNSCATADCLVMPYWNTLGVRAGTTGGAAGGNLYNLAAAFDGLSAPIRPYMQILWPNCFHECDTASTPSGSQADAFNFLLMRTQTTSGGLGGSGMGSF